MMKRRLTRVSDIIFNILNVLAVIKFVIEIRSQN